MMWQRFCLTLSLTAVGPFGHIPLEMQNTLKMLKARSSHGGGPLKPRPNMSIDLAGIVEKR